MRYNALSTLKVEQLDAVMRRVPLLREIGNHSRSELLRMLDHARIQEFGRGEVLIERGTRDTYFYFLLKGQLAVYRDSASAEPLNFISPGELFGDLAVVSRTERRATVAVDGQCRSATVLGLDFTDFGTLEDFTCISLHSKLVFFRAMVHTNRWRLELKRMERPAHQLARALRQLPNFSGERGGLDELCHLNEVAAKLASLLISWDLHVAAEADGVRDAAMAANG